MIVLTIKVSCVESVSLIERVIYFKRCAFDDRQADLNEIQLKSGI